ncbi:MAG TPA: MFS transporter [Candidatus Polarisedimenticolia bacterium]|nr:MFS transporter [Candidatus Polarisedimenticolia bacterium]
MSSSSPSPGYARYVLALLTLLNLLDYVDRYIIASVGSLIRREFEISDARFGLFGTLFFLVYLLTAPVFGYLGDRFPRRAVMALGAIVWSLATAGAALAPTYLFLLLSRGLVGIGEASFGTLSPPFLADYYAVGKRARVMAIFYGTIPAGAALAYLLAGRLGETHGWRFCFTLVGLPGLLLALPIFFLREPVRGGMDGEKQASPETPRHDAAEEFSYRKRIAHVLASYRELIRSRSYLFTNLGYAALTFAIGGMAFWMPRYLETIKGVSFAESNDLTGRIVAISGFVGTLAGGFAGDLAMRWTRRAYLLLSGIGVLAAIPFALTAIVSPRRAIFVPCLGAAVFFLFVNTGLLNAVIVSVSAPHLRATAVAANIVIIHILGDAPSPYLIGAVSDLSSLQGGILLAVVAMLISGVLLLWGSRWLPGDLDRIAHAGREGAA